MSTEYDTPKAEPTTPGPYSLQQPSRAGKVPKPIMEKRRRARINKCLEELKVLVPDLTESGSRVDKADVLEMTVEHLTRMKNKRRNLSSNLSPHVTPYVDPHVQFKQGYQQCMNEVTKLLLSSSVDENVTHKLVEHLTTRSPAPSLSPNSAMLASRLSPVTPVTRTPPHHHHHLSRPSSVPLVVPEPVRSTHLPHFAFTPAHYAQPVPTYPSPPSSPIERQQHLAERQHLSAPNSPPRLADKTHLFAEKTHSFSSLPLSSHPLSSLPSFARRPQVQAASLGESLKVWRPWS
ncbi:hypothetical protein ACHWQZ_G017995 [Mnemiopsis leidyi]